MSEGLINLTIPAVASSPAGVCAPRRTKRQRAQVASLPVPLPGHADAAVIGLAREVLSARRQVLRAQAQLPHPDAWSPMSSSCDPAVLAMDRADNEERRLRSDLAACPATTLEGLQAKVIAFLSDCGIHPDRMTEKDWADLDLEPWVESILRNILTMKATSDLAQ